MVGGELVWHFEISSTTIKKAYIYTILVTFFFCQTILFRNIILERNFAGQLVYGGLLRKENLTKLKQKIFTAAGANTSR